ncbi:DUF3108 domain-containing protein [Thalassobaculum sp. OXR-137]|uniref:DUF3108 domain-containing protein n=1 Tax=Thalassobaculum sp. OXR-137 TaxID=3100173 RepID=UPI002AC90ED4|nr:DUF3108 domain-containing protein [Thalassobaculum sp. OXR-137]WPZ34465.1 DUF3108 domain-containing protein [Thalassobaculum sp. OXR-137]
MKRLLLASLLITCATPAVAAGGPMRATYEVYFGGLHILSAQSEFAPERGRYAVTANAQTRGILDVFFSWRGETRSAGRYENDRAVPDKHTNFGWRGDERRSVILTYGPDGEVISTAIDPAPDPEEVTALPENAEAGTIDPLTVIAQVSQTMSRTGSCDGEFAVFDGRRRYDLRVSDRGTEVLPATSYSIFSGEARRCRIDYAMLGGARKAPNKYSKTARDRVVYVAQPVGDGPAIPVALKIETDFGTLMAHLTGVEVPKDLALGEETPPRGSR